MSLPSRRGPKGARSHRYAPEQERRIAAELGGKRVPGSGSGAMKGDVRVRGQWRIECKCTVHRSFSLKVDILTKITDEATVAGELPAMAVEWLGAEAMEVRRAFVVPEHVFHDLLREAGYEVDV